MQGFKTVKMLPPSGAGAVPTSAGYHGAALRSGRRLRASPCRLARGEHGGGMPPASPESMLEPASAWLDVLRRRGQTHLFYPVSRLQHRFRLGYGPALALADLLAQRGEWTVNVASDGTRYARIHTRADA